jgi:glycosyltransferase involved in cell wall biosynthesis
MPGEPLVSILITNYNYAAYVGEAIESALAQTYPHVEVVVVDDGSTDGSREIIQRYAGRIVPVFKENGGQGSAFNAGYAASSGNILCFLDADDVFFPEKVERVVDAMKRHPHVTWVKNSLTITDQRLRPLGTSFGSRARTPARTRVVRAVRAACLEHKLRFVICSGISISRSVARRCLPIERARLAEWRYCADAYVGFWCTVGGACCELAEPLGYYRRQDHQRLLGDGDIEKWLDRQIRLEARLARMWSADIGRPRIGSDVYKHTMVVDTLRGEPVWSASRWRALASALRALRRVAFVTPGLAARQVAGVLFAFVAPRAWLARLKRVLVLAPETEMGPAELSIAAPSVKPTNSIHHYT